MAKIFPIRNYNPSKNVMLAVPIVADVPVDHEAARANMAAIEAARRERMVLRAQERSIRREGQKPARGFSGGFIKIAEGVFTYYNCDVLAPTAIIDELSARKTGLMFRKLDLMKPFLDPDNNRRCVACEGVMNQISNRWPALIVISNAKPPSKKRPLGPVGMCSSCFKHEGTAEVFMTVYAMMADPTLDILDRDEDAEAYNNWVMRVKIALDGTGHDHVLQGMEWEDE